jgi:pilus assembly protein CpaE
VEFGGKLGSANGLRERSIGDRMKHSPEELIRSSNLAAILICPDDIRRRSLAQALAQNRTTVIREFAGYPSPRNLRDELDCDVVLVDLDGDVDIALDLIQSICAETPAVTVMAYSHSQDPELLRRCMRTGAREFITDPAASQDLMEALVRASARRTDDNRKKSAVGKVLVFCGAKGGSGVTTLASNFAVSLKRESGKNVLLLDLHLHLGDVAVFLGIKPQFTILDAFKSGDRLDRDLVSSLITEHKSGLSVLAAPDQYKPIAPMQNGSLGKLLYVLRDQFPYVVVDAGTDLGTNTDVLFELADTVYLVSQVDIASLRNAQRKYTYLEGSSRDRVQVILNRFDLRKNGIAEDHISKALGVTPKWKVPSDYFGVRHYQNLGEPLVTEQSPISRTVDQMARAACGKNPEGEGKRKFGLFR